MKSRLLIPVFCVSLTFLGCWTIDKSMTALENDAGFIMIILSILLMVYYNEYERMHL